MGEPSGEGAELADIAGEGASMRGVNGELSGPGLTVNGKDNCVIRWWENNITNKNMIPMAQCKTGVLM